MNNETLTRQAAIEELKKHGISGPQVYLIDIIPLLEMMWADGKAQKGEIEILREYIQGHINRVNDIAGYSLLTPKIVRNFLEQFVIKRPDPALLKTLRSFISPVRLSSSDTDTNKKLRESLLAACLDIGASSVSEYPYGLHERFDLAEKRCFFEILGSLP